MQESKINITTTGGVSELIIREGAAPKPLDPKSPVKINISGTLGAPVEFLTKRLHTLTIDKCYVLVDKNDLSVTLITNEDDEYTTGKVRGSLEYNPKFMEFGINSNKVWSPTELGMFIKMNRSYFPDKDQAMKLTTELMNFTANVNSKLEKAVKESGDRTDNFSQVVNSNLPKSFSVKISIFKGYDPEMLEVETFARVDGREVSFILLSPGANDSLEFLRDTTLNKVVEDIKRIAPELVIIEQ
ncbi:hypothetical protein [Leadbetterella byssophila]|uniref:hypothetical protein n=1 Tax=Leadbetterella byssophila TaxID=316068 RepID=UPI0039A05A68